MSILLYLYIIDYMSSNYYKGAIWTNHALDRLKERGLTQDIAAYVFNNPDKSISKNNSTTRYQKKIDKSLITIVAKQNEKSEWIILSTWADPPLPGSNDARQRDNYRKYQKAPVWKKILITAFSQITGSKF